MKQRLPRIDWKLDLDPRNNPTLARVMALPPAQRAGVFVVALLLCWLALDQWSWSWAREWGSEADRMERALSDSRTLASSVDPVAQAGAEHYGPIEPPASESEGAEAMARAVVDVVKKHSTTGFSYDAQRASTRLSGIATLGGQGDRLSRVAGEVRFESSPAEAAKIISELESNPAIEAISALRIEKLESDQRVGVRLTVEAWVFGAPAGRKA
jgi:hypothetical protein